MGLGIDPPPGEFQSTLPVGGATPPQHADIDGDPVAISIHAPRGGSDSKDAQFSLSIFGKSYKSF